MNGRPGTRTSAGGWRQGVLSRLLVVWFLVTGATLVGITAADAPTEDDVGGVAYTYDPAGHPIQALDGPLEVSSPRVGRFAVNSAGLALRRVSGPVPAQERPAAKAGAGAVRPLTAAERSTLDDALRPDKLDHVFDPKHNFDPLVRQFGSREAAMEQIIRNIGGPLPQAGRFELAREIGGQTVIIRGAVVNGVPRIGTAFTP